MRIGPSLIGAIVGGLVGVAAHVGLESSLGKEVSWFALVIGVLTGLGARSMAGDSIHKASFLRAGLTAVIGLVAILGGTYAASQMMLRKNITAYEVAPNVNLEDKATTEAGSSDDEATEEESTIEEDSSTEVSSDADSDTTDDSSEASTDDEATDEEETDESAARESAEETRPTSPALDPADLAGGDQPPVNRPLSPWQMAFVGVGTFLAYELARGGGKQQSSTEATS